MVKRARSTGAEAGLNRAPPIDVAPTAPVFRLLLWRRVRASFWRFPLLSRPSRSQKRQSWIGSKGRARKRKAVPTRERRGRRCSFPSAAAAADQAKRERRRRGSRLLLSRSLVLSALRSKKATGGRVADALSPRKKQNRQNVRRAIVGKVFFFFSPGGGAFCRSESEEERGKGAGLGRALSRFFFLFPPFHSLSFLPRRCQKKRKKDAEEKVIERGPLLGVGNDAGDSDRQASSCRTQRLWRWRRRSCASRGAASPRIGGGEIRRCCLGLWLCPDALDDDDDDDDEEEGRRPRPPRPSPPRLRAQDRGCRVPRGRRGRRRGPARGLEEEKGGLLRGCCWCGSAAAATAAAEAAAKRRQRSWTFERRCCRPAAAAAASRAKAQLKRAAEARTKGSGGQGKAQSGRETDRARLVRRRRRR